uniref:Uncharacterized protein n=1 Tax=Mola mola TaxID=94237 RepID=A0A3Q3WTS7_MOLML
RANEPQRHTVRQSCDAFQNNILTPLKSAYLYEESKQSFKYDSAVLIKNPALEEKYNAFRAKRRETGYSEEDLKESFGFLLFDDINKANALGETGLITGNSTCSTLGDPSKGVYISKYSDCLDLNRWYHGKSGYIVIIRLTKGKAKKISENYTQNFTAPTAGFDCHVSEELTTVSTKTSSFLAFERTQVRSMQFLPLISSTFLCKMTMGNYLSVIGTIFYDVGLRSTGGASIPAELPPVVKIDRAISMFDLRRLLPKTFFETSFSGEGALAFPLNNGGFLILLHSSYFLRYDDTGSSALEVLQGMFVFPDSRVIQRDAKFGHIKRAISSEILLVLPALSYAESEVEKKPIDPREELCDVFLQHMQRYATLINPRLATSPSRELSIFPDQYDVPEAHKHLYSSPEWTNRAWQNLTSYLRKPDSFQLPVSKASEILTAGQVDRVEDLDDDVYFCLSSPEEGLGSVIGQSLAVNVETSLDCSAEAQVDSTAASPRVVSDNLLIKSDDMGTKTTSTSADLPTELIVSITSAERTVTDASLISNDAQTKHNDFELSHFPTAGYQKTGGNTIDDETVTAKKVLERPELAKTKRRKLRRGHSKGQRCVSKGCIKTVKILKEDHNLKSQKEYQTKESLDHPQLNKLSNIDTRKMQKRKFDQIDPAESEEKITDPGLQRFEKDILRELEACPLKKKMERWDLKPVISECGRILVPHGLDICEQIKVLRDEAQSRKVETGHEEILANVSMNVYPRVKMEPSNAPETRVDEMEATTSKDGGNCPQNNNGMDTPPLTTVKENPPDTLFPGKCATKSASLLNRLKSVLLRKKKKTGFLVLEEMTDTTENPEPCLKKGKVDSLQGMLQSIAAISSVQDPVGIKEVSTMLSVDPHFAFALGLMPKETLDKIDKSEDLDTQQNRCSPTDALTLLADLALSARYGQGSPQPYEALERNPETSLKKCDLTRDVTHSEQESFLHALLRQPAVKPIQAPQCPLPSNVVESSELIGLISKEHAYSYPPSSSLLLDLSGTPYQVFPLSGSTRLLHRHQTINCDGIKSLHPSVNQEDKSEHSDRTSKYLIKHLVHRRKFRLSRTFVNKDGSVQVTKHWKENYDFTLDSKFTTDSKFRTICRALHGPWNISIQDTSKEIRLIFHMWIGLFYSRSTPRFFDFSSNHCSKETDSLGIPSGMLSTPAHSDLKGNSFAPCSNVTDTAHTLTSNALDLSKKDNSIVDHGSEILDLSVRNCSAESITSDPPVNEKESSASGEQEEGGETPNALKTVTALQEASLFQVSEKGNACHNLHVRKLCATGSAMTDHILSEEELIDNDPAVVENIKNVGLADLHDEISQRDGPDSIKKPTQEDSKEDTCHDLQFLNCKSKLFSNGGTLTEENYVSEQVPHASTEKEPSYNESVEENSRSHACLDDKIQTSNQTGSPNLNSGVKDWDTHLDEGEQNVEMTTRKETFCDQSHSTQSDAVTMFETDWELTKETNIKSDQTNKGSEKIHNHIVIPFIGIDTSGEDVVQQQSSGKVEEVQVQKRPPFISETMMILSLDLKAHSLVLSLTLTLRKESLCWSNCLRDAYKMTSLRELLKRSKRGPIHQLDACDELNLSPSSLVTVHFSTLEEQDNAVDHFDALSLVVPKIRVVMSDRKDLAETAEEENTLLPQKVSEETGNLMKHAGISGVTADCARQYTAMMNDVCTAKKVLSRPKLFKMDKGYSKPELSNLFDFCDQMKRETDYSFQSNMNSVVRRSCKTKYRFYLLVTSDDPFFEETKLEAEGHTAVQPSEFFLGEDSSTLLIILRNEDIAEHICEVPHLLKLKKSPGVRFAGIDEPDDVVNLTHQEVFTRGGFIMFNRTATESLSLCNMKTMTKILQELNTTGKWKWIWHYRDSRQLKENARLSAEAKEKNLFINWCQEIGLLEVLPYHECDLLSRDQPDYLTCLVHLQVQNISARYPVFITDRSFGTNGIVTLTLSSILTCSPSESFTV